MYTKFQLRLFCEIGIVKHLHDMIHNYEKNSKFGGFLKNLEKECLRIQKRKLKMPSKKDYLLAASIYDDFGYVMNWINKKQSPNSMFCFCSRLLEKSKYLKSERLLEIIVRLLIYQEECGTLKDEHYVMGDTAYTQWLRVWGDIDIDPLEPEKSKEILDKIEMEINQKNEFVKYKETFYGK